MLYLQRMVPGFIIIWLFHFISFFYCLIKGRLFLKAGGIQDAEMSSSTLVYAWLGFCLLLILLRFITGWHLRGWYLEALIVLVGFVLFDYYVLIKRQFSRLARAFYLTVRGVFLTSMVIRLLVAFFMLLMLSPVAGPYSLPEDKSDAQQVYDNIFIYRSASSRKYVFKKQHFLFEKDVAKITNCALQLSPKLTDPATGYIRKKGDSIYI